MPHISLAFLEDLPVSGFEPLEVGSKVSLTSRGVTGISFGSVAFEGVAVGGVEGM